MWKHEERLSAFALPLQGVVHKISHVSFGDCFAALQLIPSLFIGGRLSRGDSPTIFGHAGTRDPTDAATGGQVRL